MTEIDDEAFRNCWSLRQIVVPPCVKRLGKMAFAHCARLEDVDLPAGLCQIDSSAFYGCEALTGLSIPESLTCIGENAFHGCKGLAEVILPQNLKTIGNWAFSNCTGLKRVTITDHVDSFRVFSGCDHLETFAVSTPSRCYSAKDGIIFSLDGCRLMAYPPGRRRNRYDVPEGVTEILAGTFDGAQVKIVHVHKGTTLIPGYASHSENDPCFASADAVFLAHVGKPVYLGPVDDLSRKHRTHALEGFLVALEVGMPEMEPWKESYIDFVRREYAAFEKKAWQNETLLRLMMDYNMLKPETAKNMRLKYTNAGRSDLADELRAYLNSFPGVDRK